MKRIIGALVVGLVAARLVRMATADTRGSRNVSKGPMEVTVDDEGKTRVRHIYTVSAPLAGKVLRTSRHVGDQVIANDTVVAVMQPTVPGFHDVRSHEELQAALAAADAAVRFAEADMRRTEAALAFSRSELQRAEALIRTNAISLYCEKWGMRSGTHEHLICTMDLDAIRAKVEQRIADESNF